LVGLFTEAGEQIGGDFALNQRERAAVSILAALT